MKKLVKVLGTTYRITKRKYEDDEYMQENSFIGYCDGLLKAIVVCDMRTHQSCQNETPEWCASMEKQTLRHEIVHAFFNESGLESCSFQPRVGWAKNEEMVDWIALQGPKIYAAWQEAGAL